MFTLQEAQSAIARAKTSLDLDAGLLLLMANRPECRGRLDRELVLTIYKFVERELKERGVKEDLSILTREYQGRIISMKKTRSKAPKQCTFPYQQGHT